MVSPELCQRQLFVFSVMLVVFRQFGSEDPIKPSSFRAAKDEPEENADESANDRASNDAMRTDGIKMRERAEQCEGRNHECQRQEHT